MVLSGQVQKGSNIKENKAVTKSGAAGAAQRSEAVRNDPSAASAAWTDGEMTRRAGPMAQWRCRPQVVRWPRCSELPRRGARAVVVGARTVVVGLGLTLVLVRRLAAVLL